MKKSILQFIALAGLLTISMGSEVYANACKEKCDADRNACMAKIAGKKGNEPFWLGMDCDGKHIDCYKACAKANTEAGNK